MRLQPIVTASLLASITLLLYGFRLSTPPLTADETVVLQQARSGHGPILFHVADDRWLQPAAVYATKAVDAVAASNLSGRIAAVIVAALDIVLMFYCGRLIFASDAIA